MKILMVTNSLQMGGIETNLVRLTKALTGRGHQITVGARSGVLAVPTESAGAAIVPLSMRLRSLPGLLRDLHSLRRSLLAGADVVHVFSASAGVVLWLALRLVARKSRPAVVASVMGISFRPDEPRWKIRLRARLTLLSCDTLIVTSPAIGELVSDFSNAGHKAVWASVVGVEIPRPGKADCSAQIRESLGFRTEDKVVLTIGNLTPSKSHEFFIHAAAEIVGIRDNVQFLIAGGGKCYSRLKEEIEELGVVDRVHLLGERQDVEKLISSCDVYVRPGIVEGFVGITVLEAQAQRRPVVSFDTLDVRQAITHKKTGLLVPSADWKALAAAVLQLLDDPDLASSIGEAGHQHFLQHFALEAIVDGLERIYQETIDSLQPSHP